MEPDLTQGAWRMFTKDTDEDEAARLFAARYGQPPEFIVEDGPYLYAGPVPALPVSAVPETYAGGRLFA